LRGWAITFKTARLPRTEIVRLYTPSSGELTQGAWLQLFEMCVLTLGAAPTGWYVSDDPLLRYETRVGVAIDTPLRPDDAE
jgi:hypothetical protein